MTRKEFFERYQFDASDKIGASSFATLYKAKDVLLNQPVVIKKAEGKSDGKTFALADEHAFFQEIGMHENIADYKAVYSFEGEEGIDEYAILQDYPTSNLRQLMDKSPLSNDEKGAIVKEILDGLAHIHDKGYVLRNLNPTNIFIVQSREYGEKKYLPKIADFRLVKKSGEKEDIQYSDAFDGMNIAYASPEQVQPDFVTTKIDIWALGVLVFELFTGQRPFTARNTTAASEVQHQEVVQNILNARVPVSIFSVPNPYRKLVEQVLIKSQAGRPASVGTLQGWIDSPMKLAENPVASPTPKPTETAASTNAGTAYRSETTKKEVLVDDGGTGVIDAFRDARTVIPASWGARFGAFIIDRFIIFVPSFIVMLIIGMIWPEFLEEDASGPLEALFTLMILFIFYGLPHIYRASLESSKKQATWGKQIVGIHVSTEDGKRLSWLNAFGRSVGMILSGMILYIGFLMPLFSDKKQALHDMMATASVNDGKAQNLD